MRPASLSIPARFNGPPTSGNGGYSCGVLAAYVDGAARVRLLAPPPLDRELNIRRGDNGSVAMYDGNALVGMAMPCRLELDVPAAPSLSQAEQARERFPCYTGHFFETCFVCGPGRPAHDGLELFPGPVEDWQLLACPWLPAADLLDDDGHVRDEIVWSALDCPGYFAAGGERTPPAVLGELDGEILAPVDGGETLVIFAWPLGEAGRKLYAGTAIARQDGTVVARSRSTWVLLNKG